MKIIDYQIDIKLGQFTQEELDVVLTKIKNRKAANLDKIPPEVRKFDDILLRYCNAVYNQNTIYKELRPPLPKNGNLEIAKNYRSITLPSIAAKIYNVLLLNRIEPEIEKILGKTKMTFEGIGSQHHKL